MEKEIKAWFGAASPEGCLPKGDVAGMIEAMMESSDLGVEAQPDLRALARECGIADDAQYNRLLREVSLGLVRRKLRSQATAEEDLLQSIEALDDINRAVNLLDERLYEWSRLHREGVMRGRDLAEHFSGKADTATGIRELASAILELRRSRNRMEEEIGQEIVEFAPNLSKMAGPLLAARLISRAGGLKRLSSLPSSAIQVMGAEKSLFKHLHGKAPSPKHGLIYRHPAVSGAPRTLRGRVSRTLSGKLAIAARIDYFSGQLVPDLIESTEKRISAVRRRRQD